MAWVLGLLLLSFSAAQSQTCQLRVILKDKAGDGWQGNFLTIESDGGVYEDSGPCGYSERKTISNNVASLTLSLTQQDSYKLTVPQGSSLRVNFTATPDNEADENSWLVELWDFRAPFGNIVLLSGGPYTTTLTSSNSLDKVMCGPTPVCAIGAVNIGCPSDPNDLAPYVTDISWAGAFLDTSATRPTQYQVSWCNPSTGVDCSNPDNYKHVGRTSSNHLQAIFPPGGTYQLAVEAYNQFGLSPAVFTPFSTNGNLPVAEIQFIVSDSQGDGWPDDASIMVTLNGIRYASIGFPCSDEDIAKSACRVRTYKYYAPAEIDLIFEANFLAPGTTAEECSFAIVLGANHLESGQDAQGPTVHTFVYPVNLPKVTNYKAPTPPDSALVTSRDCAAESTTPLICTTLDFNVVKAGDSCTVPGVTCRKSTTCGTCVSTQLYTCLATGTWASSVGCSCDTAPACASFQLLTTNDCCNAGLTCVTDEESHACNGPTPWGDCIPDSGECGRGKQYRNEYVREADVCRIDTQTQTCEVECPVDCVGAWSGWSTCTGTCGAAYQTNTYQVSVFPKNGGKNCPFHHGQLDWQQCPGLPDCENKAFNCYYDLKQFDIQGDGWASSKLSYQIDNQDPVSVPFTAPTSELIYTKQVTPFVAPNGSTVKLILNCNSNDADVADTSYSVTQVIPLEERREKVRNIVQSPAELALNDKPESTSFTASCVNCANTDCLSKKRVSCELAQAGDLTCGPCLPGYGLPKTSGDRNKPGTTTCLDLNECLASGDDYCALTNQRCENKPGGFACKCDGTIVQGQCRQLSLAALLQRESGVKPHRRDIRWAHERLQHKHYLQSNPSGSFMEMDMNAKTSARLGLVPTLGSGGAWSPSTFFISRCVQATTCSGTTPTNYYSSGGVNWWLGDDHADNIFWNYTAGYAYSVNPSGAHTNTPQTFRMDGGTIAFNTYPSYGPKKIWPHSTKTKPFGMQTSPSGWETGWQQDPNGCCAAIYHREIATNTYYNWNVGASGNYQVVLTTGAPQNFYLWTIWNCWNCTPTPTTTAAPITTPAPTTPAPPPPCGQWNQSCCSDSCGSGLYCEPITLTCQTPCPSKITRKEWLEMTYAERDTFVRAIQILYNPNGPQGCVFCKLRALHSKASMGDANDVHQRNGWFLPWHRFFLLDYNKAINALGGEFACVGIPYWDWSKVSLTADGVSNLLTDLFTNDKKNGLWKGIGRVDGCARYSDGHPLGAVTAVNVRFWYWCGSPCQWIPTELADGQAYPGTYHWDGYKGAWNWVTAIPTTCIYRTTAIYNTNKTDSTPPAIGNPGGSGYASYPTNGYYNGAWGGYGPYAMFNTVLSATTYKDFNDLVGAYGHVAMHVWIGGFMGWLSTASYDPMFYMVHAMVDMMWAAWQACAGITPITDDLISNQNPKVWNWASGVPFTGDTANLPLFDSARTPGGAYDINALGYQYTDGFIQNVISKAGTGGAAWCNQRGTGFVPKSLIQARERFAKRHAIYHDPKNPPKVVATSFLEAFTPVNYLPASSKKVGKGRDVKDAKRKKKLAVARGTDAKPGCYTPKKDEVNNLKDFSSVYKKVRRGNSHSVAITAVKDIECNQVEYQSAVIGDAQFLQSMGSQEERAQGKMHHECYLRQKGKKAEQIASPYKKDLKKKGKWTSPKKAVVPKPSAKFLSEANGPKPPPEPVQPVQNYGTTAAPQTYSYRFNGKQSPLGPM